MHSPSLDLLHIHIPKCGGTALEQCLALAGVDWRDAAGGISRHLAHEPAIVWRREMGEARFARAWKFAVVRHPGAVLVSLYHYHRDKNPPPQIHWIPPHVSFAQWMREHVADAPEWVAQEFGNLLWWVTGSDGRGLVDAIWKLEDLATPAGWDDFLDTLEAHCPAAPWSPDRRPVFLPDNTTSHAPWESYFQGEDKDLRLIVERRYARDFKAMEWGWGE